MIDLGVWKRAWAFLDAREKLYALSVLVIVIVSALASATMVASVMPFLSVLSDSSRIETTPALSEMYHWFGYTSTYEFLVGLGFLSFSVIVLASLIQIAKTWYLTRFAMMRMHSISHRLLDNYLGQPYAFFLDRHSGEMGPRILSESTLVVTQFFRPAAELIASIMTTVAIVALLMWVNPLVATVSFVIFGSLYGVIYLLSRRVLRRLGLAQVETNRKRFRLVNESLMGIKDIKLLGREEAYLIRFEKPSFKLAETIGKIAVFSQVPQIVLQAFALGGIILLCLLLIEPKSVASGAALGELLPVIGVFAFAGQRLMPELSKVYQSLAQIQASKATVDSIYEDFVLEKSECSSPTSSVSRLEFKHTLRLNSVSFSYPNSDLISLKDVTLNIKAGEKVGIVGSTGAGKTTLVDVLLGLLQPDQGSISVDDKIIDEKNLQLWMKCVGYVPQDIFLTDATVAENIALGITPNEINREGLREAARIARIDKFIEGELAAGYDTYIGERGVRLSGGQRQRIGIARAMYRDAAVIIFDEATSALDNLTEAKVMESIEALPGDKTVIVIAHRLSTVKQCDRIIVLEDGRIVGCGSWDELIIGNIAFKQIAKHLETK